MPSWGGAGRGAAIGAAAGSFVPGVGNLVGGGVGALIGGLRGGDDEDATPSATPGGGAPTLASVTKQLSDRASQPNAHGDNEGEDMLRQFAEYFRNMIADPMAATTAERGRVIDQYDTARRSALEFGPRGSGGSTSASALSRVSQANQLSDTTNAATTNAADKGAGIAAQLAQLGISEEQLRTMDLGQLLQAVMGQEQLRQGDANRRGQMISGMAEGVGTLLGLYLTRNQAA